MDRPVLHHLSRPCLLGDLQDLGGPVFQEVLVVLTRRACPWSLSLLCICIPRRSCSFAVRCSRCILSFRSCRSARPTGYIGGSPGTGRRTGPSDNLRRGRCRASEETMLGATILLPDPGRPSSLPVVRSQDACHHPRRTGRPSHHNRCSTILGHRARQFLSFGSLSLSLLVTDCFCAFSLYIRFLHPLSASSRSPNQPSSSAPGTAQKTAACSQS